HGVARTVRVRSGARPRQRERRQGLRALELHRTQIPTAEHLALRGAELHIVGAVRRDTRRAVGRRAGEVTVERRLGVVTRLLATPRVMPSFDSPTSLSSRVIDWKSWTTW